MRPRRAVTPEKAEQSHIVQLLRSLGGTVYVLGTRRRKGDFAGTMMTPGLPDLQAFLPDSRFVPATTFRLVFVEVKASSGRLRPEQRELQTLCQQAGIDHIVGGYNAVIAWLLERGYVRRDQFPDYRLPVQAAK